MQSRDSAGPFLPKTNESANGRESSYAVSLALSRTFKVTLTVPKRDYLVPILSGDAHTWWQSTKGAADSGALRLLGEQLRMNSS